MSVLSMWLRYNLANRHHFSALRVVIPGTYIGSNLTQRQIVSLIFWNSPCTVKGGLLQNSYVYVYVFGNRCLVPRKPSNTIWALSVVKAETSLVKPYPTIKLTILLWSLPCAIKGHSSQTTLMFMHMYSDIISESLESLEKNANTIFVLGVVK